MRSYGHLRKLSLRKGSKLLTPKKDQDDHRIAKYFTRVGFLPFPIYVPNFIKICDNRAPKLLIFGDQPHIYYTGWCRKSFTYFNYLISQKLSIRFTSSKFHMKSLIICYMCSKNHKNIRKSFREIIILSGTIENASCRGCGTDIFFLDFDVTQQ